jgi:hypothetical protein
VIDPKVRCRVIGCPNISGTFACARAHRSGGPEVGGSGAYGPSVSAPAVVLTRERGGGERRPCRRVASQLAEIGGADVSSGETNSVAAPVGYTANRQQA